jgi:hypothetical protein
MIAVLAMTVALVADDGVNLRAAPRELAAVQAQLVRGDWLEVRGEVPGWLQVYDYRRERPGYVRPASVRVHPLEPGEAPALRAIVDFLRDARGYESLGIGAAALLLRCDPAADDASLQLAIGLMADRLARQPNAAHRDVAESYGVKFVDAFGAANPKDARSSGAVSTCYDGSAFRGVLAAGKAAPDDRARAALALTSGCLPAMPQQEVAWNEWRLQVLEQVEPEQSRLGMLVRLRRADAWSRLAFHHARSRDPKSAHDAEEATRELMLSDAGLLAEEDAQARFETRTRVAASRWAADPVPATDLKLSAGKPGETCISIESAKRCTYGVVWAASARGSGATFAVSVQPLESWTELWVFHKGRGGWRVSVLPPGTEPSVPGAVEAAGISADGSRILAFRQTARVRRFEERRAGDLRLLHSSLQPIGRYSSPQAVAAIP